MTTQTDPSAVPVQCDCPEKSAHCFKCHENYIWEIVIVAGILFFVGFSALEKIDRFYQANERALTAELDNRNAAIEKNLVEMRIKILILEAKKGVSHEYPGATFP